MTWWWDVTKWNVYLYLHQNVFSSFPGKVDPQVSKKMTKEQIEAIFAKFDNNGDGKMSKEEFKQLMESKKS